MKRTIGVWIILIYCTLNAVIGIVGFYALLSGNVPHTTPQRDNFFATLGLLDWFLALSFHLCIAIAGIYLFLLRPLALPIFIAAAACKLTTDFWQLESHRLFAGVGGPSSGVWVAFVVSWAILLATIAYVARLFRGRNSIIFPVT